MPSYLTLMPFTLAAGLAGRVSKDGRIALLAHDSGEPNPQEHERPGGTVSVQVPLRRDVAEAFERIVSAKAERIEGDALGLLRSWIDGALSASVPAPIVTDIALSRFLREKFRLSGDNLDSPELDLVVWLEPDHVEKIRLHDDNASPARFVRDAVANGVMAEAERTEHAPATGSLSAS